MFLGCVVMLVFVWVESIFINSSLKLNDPAGLANFTAEYISKHIELQGDENKDKLKIVFCPCNGRKHKLVITKPNVFQWISVVNFIILFVVLIVRLIRSKSNSEVDFNATEFVNVSGVIDAQKTLTYVDGINTLLIFFSLFYYSS
jgi:hypothetical protein